MIALSINLNKIALIRNSRDTKVPNIPEHARMVLDAGADGITVHPRPDQRHIRADDCRDLAALLSHEYAAVEFNIEGNPFAGPRKSEREGVNDYPGFMQLIRELKPAQCTLVPDGDAQLTSDHGFDLRAQSDALAPVIQELKQLGVRSSLFMDPEPEQMLLAAQLGADRIELYTESYAQAAAQQDAIESVYSAFVETAQAANETGLGVNAGHDLNLENLPRFRDLPGLLEVSIGHAFTVDALRIGIPAAVAAYQQALEI
ncbi:MAG: pyridoxine 5'-phosphate synthase [Pseudomonadota bacterium]